MENISNFDFYLKFTRPLILNLPHVNDRVLAAAWTKRLKDDANIDEKIKLDYLKLLLFVLQRKRLAAPFTKHPNAVEVLEPFPENQTLVDVAKTIIEQDNLERWKKQKLRMSGEGGDIPPFMSDFSADLLEYVAIQNIDNFGVHGYYAVSKHPLSNWHKVDKTMLPKAAKSMLEVGLPPPVFLETLSSPDLSETRAETPSQAPPTAESPPSEPPTSEPVTEPPSEAEPELEPEAAPEPPTESEAEPPTEAESTPRRSTPKKSPLGAKPPSRPIGNLVIPPEDREPPTWGSNLLSPEFLQEDLGDIVASAEAADAPAELLWTSGIGAGHGGFADVSMPSFFESSMISQAGSLAPSPKPVFIPAPIAPSTPKRAPPPKKVKKPPPPVKQTRAAMLLQKKKQADLAPPPPPAKKPSLKKIAKKPSKTKAAQEPPPEEAPPKKGVAKKPSKGKTPGKGKAPSRSQFPSPGEGHKGFQSDDVEGYLDELTELLSEMNEQYQQDLVKFHETYQEPEEYEAKAEKQQLSRIAKMSPQRIPKAHDIAVELDKSIHLSPDAREIFRSIIEGPAASAGVEEHDISTLRHPEPKLKTISETEAVEETTEEEGTESEVTTEEEEIKDYATTDRVFGKTPKDPRLVSAYNEMTDAAAKITDLQEGNVEEDDFEAMERMFEEEERREGRKTPKKRKEKIDRDKFHEGLRRYIALHDTIEEQSDELDRAASASALPEYLVKRGPQLEEDEEQWVPGSEFFEEADEKYRTEVPVAQKMQYLFPDMDLAEVEEEDLLPESLIETAFSPPAMAFQATAEGYHEHLFDSPAYAGVPVTTPRPTVAPVRPAPWKPPPSPPKTAEELRPVEEVAAEIFAKYPPEHFQTQLESPPREYHELKPVPDPGAVSPMSKTWAADLERLHETLYGTPQRVPDLFDLPAERVFAESPPKDWASPAQVEYSPVDVKALKESIRKERVKPQWRTEFDFRPGLTIQRYSHGPKAWHPPIPEGGEPPTFLTQEEKDLRLDLEAMDKIKDRRPIKMPYKHMRELQRRSPAPKLASVKERYESPEKKYPTVFDQPEMDEDKIWGELPPEGWEETYVPLSPEAPIDMESLRKEIREGAASKSPDARLMKPMKKPRLQTLREDYDAEQQRLWERTKDAGYWPPLPFPKKKMKPTLSPIGSPIDYPESPVATMPAPPSPGGRQGPLRRTLRKKLRKRRLDFTEYDMSPDEAQVEVTQIETTVQDQKMPWVDDLPDFDEIPGQPPITEEERQFTTPPRGSPRSYTPSPVRPTAAAGSPGTPEQHPIFSEQMPWVEDLPEFDPASPMSQWGVLEGVMDEVKAYQHPGYRVPKGYNKPAAQFKRYPWRHLEEVEELPGEEQEAAEEDIRRGIMDQPLPGELPPPMSPKRQIPGYESPPTRYIPLKELPYRPDYAQPVFKPSRPRSPDEEQEEFDKWESLIKPSEDYPTYTAEAGPPGFSARVDATAAEARRLQALADEQYAGLLSPPRTPKREATAGYKTPAKNMEQMMAELQAMGPSPGLLKQWAEIEAREKAEAAAKKKGKRGKLDFDYQQTTTTGGAGKSKVQRPKSLRPPKKTASSHRAPPKTAASRPKAKEEEKPPEKGAKGKGKAKVVKPVKSDKSIKSVKSDKSVKSQKSDASVKSAKSDKPKKPKPKKPKYDVPSKINTGIEAIRQRRRGAEAPMVVQVDVAALQDLGVTAEDLRNINLNDAPGLVRLEAAPIVEEMYTESEGPQIERRHPTEMSPVSPSQLRGELEAHEYYDPERKRMKQHIRIKGRKIPMTSARRPRLGEIDEIPGRYDERGIGLSHLEQSQAAAAFRLQWAREQGLAEEEAQPGPFPEEMDMTPTRFKKSVKALEEEAEPWAGAPVVLQAVSPQGPLFDEEQIAMMEADRRQLGGVSPLGPHERDFQWMRPTRRDEGKYPWDED